MFWSVAPTVKLAPVVPVVAAVGVPDKEPDELRLRPAGSVPEVTAKLYGLLPPLALKVAVYAVPTVPAVSGDTGLTVMIGQNALIV